jgi:hypothetical protein
MKRTLLMFATVTTFVTLAGSVSAAIPANGQYQLVNRATGLALDNYSLTANGSPVRQYPETIHTPQMWTLSTVGSYKKFQCVQNGLFLDSIGRTADGSVCGQWAGGGSINQQWTIQDLGTGYYRIVNRANGKALDTGGLTATGSDVQMWYVNGSQNQQWAFLPPGATFYADRSYAGTKSQRFGVGTYNTSQMVAKGSADNSADSLRMWWPGYSALCYNSGDLSGTPVIFTENSQTMPGMAGIMSSVRIQAGYPSGITYRTASGGLEEFRPGFLFGTWVFMHRGDWAQLKSSGASKYTVRYETEYWVKSGVINYPLIEVLSGTNVRYATNGGSDPGTCTGTPLPWEEYWNLNGEVRWTNVEGNCAMNIAIRDGGP